MNTFATLKTSIQNNVRRNTAEYLAELDKIVNDAQDQICQRKQYWFLEQNQTFTYTIGVGTWWQLNLPVGASYSALPDDVLVMQKQFQQGNNISSTPVEYLPYELASQIYPLPGANSAPGDIQAYSETLDYTGLILWPVPSIQYSGIFVKWRARSLPDLINAGDHNVLTDDYFNVILEWAVALSWKFFGMNSRYEQRLNYADVLAKKTIDKESTRKKWARIKTLPQRKGLEIPRQTQVPQPYRNWYSY